MDIAKAIIAAIATILSSVLTLLIKEYFERRRFNKIGSEIRDAVYGKWTGQIHQALNGDKRIFETQLELKVSSAGVITGKAEVPHPNKNGVYYLSLDGGFYSERFLKINYENSNKAILQFGTFVFMLSPNADKLTGHFVGYGNISEAVIAGSAQFKKV